MRRLILTFIYIFLSLEAAFAQDSRLENIAAMVQTNRVSASVECKVFVAESSTPVTIKADILAQGDCYYAESFGYGVVRDYVGHGIGRKMHEEPSVPNYDTGRPGIRLRKGMVLAIEPMINIGTWDTVLADDGWKVSTADGTLSAHYENTVAITSDGPRILTRAD